MKKIFIIFAIALISVSAYAQKKVVAASDTLYIFHNNTLLFKRATNQIDSLTFTNATTPPERRVVADIDGNDYEYVTVNGIDWLTANLKTTRFNDGTAIAQSSFPASTAAYTGNSESVYFFYNFHAVATEKICPTGWHVPSRDDLLDLFSTVPNGSSTSPEVLNELHGINFFGSGFISGSYQMPEYVGYWTRYEENATNGQHTYAISSNSNFSLGDTSKDAGLPVRCVRIHEESSIGVIDNNPINKK